jgi:hypothetical protein
MDTTKTHKKKRPLKSRLNLDKLSDNIDNFNLEIEDFRKILSQYSIPAFEKDSKDISDLLHSLNTSIRHKTLKKKKLQKEQKRIEAHKKAEVDQNTLDNFFDSINTEIDKKETEKKNDTHITKTHKRVRFSDPSNNSNLDKKKDTKITLDSLIENVSKKKEEKSNDVIHKEDLKSPTKKILYNPDPRIDIKEHVSKQLYESEVINQIPRNDSNVDISRNDKNKEIRLVKINDKYLNKNDDDFEEADENPSRNNKIVVAKPKIKTKEELYQEMLENKINIIENKIKEYEYYSQTLDKNHPILLQLRIDIINEKQKLKELLGTQTKDKKEFSATISNQNREKDVKEKEVREKQVREKDENKMNVSTKQDPLIFKYDPKIVEKEYQQMLKKHGSTNLIGGTKQTQKVSNHKSLKNRPLQPSNSEKMTILDTSNSNIKSKVIKKETSVTQMGMNALNKIPRFNNISRNTVIQNNNPVDCPKDKPSDIKHIYYNPDEETPTQQKKVKVNEL